MVQLMNSGNFRSKSDTQCPKKLLVKVEIEDSLDEEHGPINKRSKLSSPFEQQWIKGGSTFLIPPPQYNPLDEPSPLGLRLKKSPSFLDLIQMRLSQGNTFTLGASHCENHDLGKKTTDLKGSIGTSVVDKLKASNFPASLLRIGSWEYVSRYEGDLVAKCYFAKHKLVWEVLDGGLKSKMEIQWSDITALKANCPDNGLGTLDIVLARQPLFFRETNPQPRKHTLWQATSDFTGGQASMHRQHFLQCPQGLLSKHFEKLFQCDPRLNWLSQQPEIVLESPYFESSGSVLKDPDESKCHGFDHVKNEDVPTFPCFRDARSPSAAQSSSPKSELRDLVGRAPDLSSRETPSPSSAMDSHAIEEYGSIKAEGPKGPSNWDQFKVPGIHTSMSMSDLVSRIGHCISEQMTSSNVLFSEGLQNHEMLDDLAQYLFSDSNHTYTSDDPSLMSRVNSLCCLLQKDATTVQNLQVNSEGGNPDRPVDGKHIHPKSTLDSTGANRASADVPPPECEFNNDVPECKKPPAMPRIDSLGDLLLHFPRIASLPKFLFNFPEDGENQAR